MLLDYIYVILYIYIYIYIYCVLAIKRFNVRLVNVCYLILTGKNGLQRRSWLGEIWPG